MTRSASARQLPRLGSALLLAFLLLPACGDDFVSPPDAPADSLPNSFSYVGGGSVGPSSTQEVVSVPPTHAGDLITVAVFTLNVGGTAPVPGLEQVGYSVLTQVHADETDCNRSLTIWSLGGVAAGVENVRISYSGSGTYSADVGLFTGLNNAGGRLQPFETSQLAASDVVRAPTIDATEGNVVLSAVVTCGTLTGLSTDTTNFTSLATRGDSATAFLIPGATAKYGAGWAQNGSTTAAGVSVVFR